MHPGEDPIVFLQSGWDGFAAKQIKADKTWPEVLED